MTPFEAFFLALIQGVTEFLPISSSAHLILVPYLMSWRDHPLAFDVMSNGGTLVAAVVYFRHDLRRTLVDIGPRLSQGLSTLRGSGGGDGAPRVPSKPGLAFGLVVASLPVLIIAFIFHDWFATTARQPVLIASTSIGFGLLLYWSERIATEHRELEDLSWWDSLVIGCGQAMALLPGTSRSGITITSGLALGFDRGEAARFSFLLAIPVGVAAFLRDGYEVVVDSSLHGEWPSLLIGFVVSGLSAYMVIGWLLRWLAHSSLSIFVVYRVLLGLVILGLVWLQ